MIRSKSDAPREDKAPPAAADDIKGNNTVTPTPSAAVTATPKIQKRPSNRGDSTKKKKKTLTPVSGQANINLYFTSGPSSASSSTSSVSKRKTSSKTDGDSITVISSSSECDQPLVKKFYFSPLDGDTTTTTSSPSRIGNESSTKKVVKVNATATSVMATPPNGNKQPSMTKRKPVKCTTKALKERDAPIRSPPAKIAKLHVEPPNTDAKTSKCLNDDNDPRECNLQRNNARSDNVSANVVVIDSNELNPNRKDGVDDKINISPKAKTKNPTNDDKINVCKSPAQKIKSTVNIVDGKEKVLNQKDEVNKSTTSKIEIQTKNEKPIIKSTAKKVKKASLPIASKSVEPIMSGHIKQSSNETPPPPQTLQTKGVDFKAKEINDKSLSLATIAKSSPKPSKQQAQQLESGNMIVLSDTSPQHPKASTPNTIKRKPKVLPDAQRVAIEQAELAKDKEMQLKTKQQPPQQQPQQAKQQLDSGNVIVLSDTSPQLPKASAPKTIKRKPKVLSDAQKVAAEQAKLIKDKEKQLKEQLKEHKKKLRDEELERKRIQKVLVDEMRIKNLELKMKLVEERSQKNKEQHEKKLLKIKELEEKKLNNDKIKSEKIVKIEKNESEKLTKKKKSSISNFFKSMPVQLQSEGTTYYDRTARFQMFQLKPFMTMAPLHRVRVDDERVAQLDTSLGDQNFTSDYLSTQHNRKLFYRKKIRKHTRVKKSKGIAATNDDIMIIGETEYKKQLALSAQKKKDEERSMKVGATSTPPPIVVINSSEPTTTSTSTITTTTTTSTTSYIDYDDKENHIPGDKISTATPTVAPVEPTSEIDAATPLVKGVTRALHDKNKVPTDKNTTTPDDAVKIEQTPATVVVQGEQEEEKEQHLPKKDIDSTAAPASTTAVVAAVQQQVVVVVEKVGGATVTPTAAPKSRRQQRRERRARYRASMRVHTARPIVDYSQCFVDTRRYFSVVEKVLARGGNVTTAPQVKQCIVMDPNRDYGVYKTLMFKEDYRPPYHGTHHRLSSVVRPRNPFGKDEKIQYDYDSEEDWDEEEEAGESCGLLSGGDDGPADDKAANNHHEEDIVNFCVPDGYLSKDEMCSENEKTTAATTTTPGTGKKAAATITAPMPMTTGIAYMTLNRAYTTTFLYEHVVLLTRRDHISFTAEAKKVLRKKAKTKKMREERKKLVPEIAKASLVQMLHYNAASVDKMVDAFVTECRIIRVQQNATYTRDLERLSRNTMTLRNSAPVAELIKPTMDEFSKAQLKILIKLFSRKVIFTKLSRPVSIVYKKYLNKYSMKANNKVFKTKRKALRMYLKKIKVKKAKKIVVIPKSNIMKFFFKKPKLTN